MHEGQRGGPGVLYNFNEGLKKDLNPLMLRVLRTHAGGGV